MVFSAVKGMHQTIRKSPPKGSRKNNLSFTGSALGHPLEAGVKREKYPVPLKGKIQFLCCASRKHITMKSLAISNSLYKMIISNANQMLRLEPRNENHNPCPDPLRCFLVSISKIHADGDRRSASPTGRPATNSEEATAHARGSYFLVLGLPDLARLEECPDDRTAQNGTCLAAAKIPRALEKAESERQNGSATGIQ